MAQHVSYARSHLRPLECLAAGPVGFVCDLLYGSTLVVYSAVWTIRGRSALGGEAPGSGHVVSVEKR
jgi:hypothetical protein